MAALAGMPISDGVRMQVNSVDRTTWHIPIDGIDMRHGNPAGGCA